MNHAADQSQCPVIRLIPIKDADDSRLEDYRDIRDRDLRGEAGRPGLFIGEQSLIVEKMLLLKGLTRSVLIAPNLVDRISRFVREAGGAVLSGDDPDKPAGGDGVEPVPVYVAAPDVMRRVAGFPIHRGALALGVRPSPRRLTIDAAIRKEAGLLTVLLCEDITNIDNIGALFRNAAAFAVDAVVLSPKCHDPLYRKSVRVSIGHVLSMPWARSNDWHGDLRVLRAEWGITLIAAATHARAKPLDAIEPPQRVGLVVGQEYEGLSHSTLDLCDHIARVPMAEGVDSLNVAVASAVMLHRFSRGRRS